MAEFSDKADILDPIQPSIHILSTSDRIRQQYLSLIRNTEGEILLMFPTINSIHREHSIGVLDELSNAAKRGVKIRILSAEDDFIKERLDSMRAHGITIRKIETPTESKFKMLITDRKSAFIVETKDDSRAEFKDAIGNAMFSSSKSTVLPFVTIFESFWRETDLYERARESDKIKEEFVNIAAHELRNPIMPILSGAELINDLLTKIKGKVDSEVYDDIISNSKVVSRNATKLLRLSEDILQVSRIESGTFALNIELADIDDILETGIADIKRRYDGERPNVKISLDSKLGKQNSKIYCDASKIAQTFTNLLDNAMKFTKDGEVLVSAAVYGREIVISIRDSGTGIDQDIKARIFEKFVTKSNSGTGLGLYLSKKIVESHSGRIWTADNKNGRGVTFSFSIPDDISPQTTDSDFDFTKTNMDIIRK